MEEKEIAQNILTCRDGELPRSMRILRWSVAVWMCAMAGLEVVNLIGRLL